MWTAAQLAQSEGIERAPGDDLSTTPAPCRGGVTFKFILALVADRSDRWTLGESLCPLSRGGLAGLVSESPRRLAQPRQQAYG